MPKYTNHCGHKDHEFIGTVVVHNSKRKLQEYDVYVYANSRTGHGICIRYGEEPSEYLSPGTVINLARAKSSEVYYDALSLIENECVFLCGRRGA